MDAAEKMNLTEAVSFIVYRARHDAEKPVKNAAYAILARMNTGEAAAFLTERLTDKKTGDGTKAEIAKNLMKEGSVGESEIIALAKEQNREFYTGNPRSFVVDIARDKKAKDSNRKRAAKLAGLEEE